MRLQMTLNHYAWFPFVFLPASFSEGASVRKAELVEGNSAKIEVMYSGGCTDHTFHLVAPSRSERDCPLQVRATLLDSTPAHERCNSIVLKTVTLPLPKWGEGCKPLQVVIAGDDGSETQLSLGTEP